MTDRLQETLAICHWLLSFHSSGGVHGQNSRTPGAFQSLEMGFGVALKVGKGPNDVDGDHSM
jgi:hypothetical protein